LSARQYDVESALAVTTAGAILMQPGLELTRSRMMSVFRVCSILMFDIDMEFCDECVVACGKE
jgi:hypothetical protein